MTHTSDNIWSLKSRFILVNFHKLKRSHRILFSEVTEISLTQTFLVYVLLWLIYKEICLYPALQMRPNEKDPTASTIIDHV